MTTGKNISLDVSILGREFRIACPEPERDRLLQSAVLLDRKMREIRDAGKVSSLERIAVMAALLGVTPPDDARGCLQDIHWYDGAWGYFPTYTMGAMTAVQLFDAASRALPEP